MKILKTLNSILNQGEFTRHERNLIAKAYNFSEKAHKGQFIDSKRKVSFFNHPAYAGYFLAKWGQNAEAVAAGLLHDIVEDCGIKLFEINRKFGKKVAFYVDGMSWFRRKIHGKMKKD